MDYLADIDGIPAADLIGGAGTTVDERATGGGIVFRCPSGQNGNRKARVDYPMPRPDTTPEGLWQRYVFELTQETVDMTTQAGQIKLLLNRQAGSVNPPSWLSIGTGAQYPQGAGNLVAQIDNGTGPALFSVPIVGGQPFELITHYRGDVANVWVDGVHVLQDFQDARMGAGAVASAGQMEARVGMEWTQGTPAGGTLEVRLLEASASDQQPLMVSVPPVTPPTPPPTSTLTLDQASIDGIGVAVAAAVLAALPPALTHAQIVAAVTDPAALNQIGLAVQAELGS